jgi:hypothetical protein
MKLYHGSKNGNLAVLKKMQAEAGDGVEVPEDELKNGIYLTPRYGFALACGARPEGVTQIDDVNKKIEFEHPEKFDPDLDVYIYEVEVDENYARRIDDNQYLIENLDEVKTTVKHEHKAKEVQNYYELKNWKEPGSEMSSEFKMR